MNATPHGHATRLDYHQRLLTDPHRMVAYHRALERLVEPGMVVLDAGAGTGVLAMMAARAGAAKVYAVESMPVAELARELIAHNGLADRIEVIQADLRTLAPKAPVDLVVSDCLGRFLFDDQMLDAMAAAFRWLGPRGVVAPSKVELFVAPVSAGHLPLIDAFTRPVLGIDLAPLGHAMSAETWGGAFPPGAVMGAPVRVATWDLPGPAPTVDAEVTFALSAGRLVGLAGWFRATLAEGIVLDTAPGVETHWHQVFWPWPAKVVEGGRLAVGLRLESQDGEPRWSWSGQLDGEPLVSSVRPLCAVSDGDALDEEGAASWEADPSAARECFEQAATAPGRRSVEQWENLGIARFSAEDYALAVAPLLRAYAEDTRREQSLRLLVSAAFLSGRQADGARWLAEYEARFGPHPAGWHRS